MIVGKQFGITPTPSLRKNTTAPAAACRPMEYVMPQNPAAVIPSHLAQAAALPEVDPCDVAEAAMPDLVVGDLSAMDEAWVRTHTLTCRYCATVLESLEDVCASLDTCNESLIVGSPTFPLPSAAKCLGLGDARYGYMDSPVGELLLAVTGDGLAEISFLRDNDQYDTLRELEERGFLVYERQAAVEPVAAQLREYFQQQRDDFTVPVDLTGVTDFTRRVLESASTIPYGKVWTYGDVARTIGQPRASRAVGNALGRNPVPVIIPCHRVVLASGGMGWYTGGPDIKRKLLGIEGHRWAPETQAVLPVEQAP